MIKTTSHSLLPSWLLRNQRIYCWVKKQFLTVVYRQRWQKVFSPAEDGLSRTKTVASGVGSLLSPKRIVECKTCRLCTSHYNELISNIDTKAKCHRNSFACKGTLRQVFIWVYRLDFFWRYSHPCWYFDYFGPSFVNCCPSNLLSD